MTPSNLYREAATKSITLSERGEYDEALKLLDESIAAAFRSREVNSICTLCHHAAILSRFAKDSQLAKGYYQQSLAARSDNPRALYGLATIAFDQGELETARHYAGRCCAALLQSDDETLKQGLLDLVVKH
jgi:Tfp pilus assembly protein PilF